VFLLQGLKKYFFFKETVNYIGHVICPGKLAVAANNTRALREEKPPTTQTEIRSFLGLCNVYRRFVAGFAKIASPLNALIRKGESPRLGELSSEQLAAFEKLRDNLLNPPFLALPRVEGRFTLDTDACDEQIGCTLFQDQPDGSKHPIGYWSRGLTGAEKSYSTTEQECFAIVWAVLHLRPYLEGKRFVIRTDHDSIQWVLNLADAQGRLDRWRLRLLEFDFEVQYSPGKAHHGKDTMSRLPSTDPEIMSLPKAIDTEILCLTVGNALLNPRLLPMEDVCDLGADNPSCCERATFVGAHSMVEYDDFNIPGRPLPSEHFAPELPEIVHDATAVAVVRDRPRHLPDSPTTVCVDASLLRRGVTPEEHGGIFAVLPQPLLLENILSEQDHDYPKLAGHSCSLSMFLLQRRRYFWRNPAAKVAKMVRQCAVRAKNRIHKSKKQFVLKLLPAKFAEAQARSKDRLDRSAREKNIEFQVQSCLEARKELHAAGFNPTFVAPTPLGESRPRIPPMPNQSRATGSPGEKVGLGF
jgi:RNase H-like domain found in reverse transcriptase